MTTLTAPESDLAELDLGNMDLWQDGPPHELFARMRAMPGLHWSPLDAFPEESGFWSVVRFADIATVGRDHATYSSSRSIVFVDKLSWDGTPDPVDLAAGSAAPRPPEGARAAGVHSQTRNRAHRADARDHQYRL